MINENVTVTGMVFVELKDCEGKILQSFEVPNLVVFTGKKLMARRLIGTADSVMSHIAIGTSSTIPVPENITLGNEVARSTLTSSVSDNIVTYVSNYPANVPVGGGNIVEAGIFNAATGGILLNRVTFPKVPKLTTDTLTITWKLTIN